MSMGLTEGFYGLDVAHREDIRAYLEGLKIDGIAVDWGSGAKPVKNYVKGSAQWLTIDNNPKANPDKLWDITKTIKLSSLYDHAFCMEVLEHVTDPQAVMNNISNNLDEKGTLHLSVPFLFPIHGDEDYWRFTPKGLEVLTSRAGLFVNRIWEITDGYLMEASK